MTMEVNKIFLKLKELSHVSSKREELTEYCKLAIEQIINYLPRRILSSDGGDILNCVFIGLSDTSNSCKTKVRLIDLVLQTMRKESASLSHCSDVISRLCLELPKMPADDLVRWSNDSVQSIVDDSDVNLIWRDVLPECMSTILTHDSIKHCGTDMSSSDYKEQCVRTLCQCRWTERQLVQLAAMFTDMQLSRNDHKQVVNKICSYIIDIAPDALPPLVHQLLKLCKLYNMELMLSHLSHYFSARLYSKLEPPQQDSESTTMDVDDIVQHSPAELSRCLSTCIYHITQGAADPELIRKILKQWPKTQLLRAPFLIDIALAVSNMGADFRSVCLDVIKSAIEQRITDELRVKESAWVRSILPPDVDVVSLLKVLTTESANHRQLTVVGLINLAFSLLAVYKAKPVAQQCWSHGKLILVRLSKSQPETASHILSQLADKLAGDNTQRQYAECLYVLCKLTPVSVERCTQLSTILENCQPSPTDYKTASAVLDAVHPLINFSTRTRDTLVMVCRKGLYSRDSVHRRLALSGFLTVLRHVKVSRGTFSSSQNGSDQYSANSYLTQLTVDLHATNQGAVVTSRFRNEAVCMEVVSILRRCLLQDAAVKQLLYTNLQVCAKDKPVLHESILELLYEHLSKYLPDNQSDGTLLMDKCVQITPITAVLVEPMAHLLYVISQFVQSVEEDLDDILASQTADNGCTFLKSKLTNVMDQLCVTHNFGNVDMDDPGLTDLTPESKAKSIKVQQILQCYETLIAYKIMQWTASSDDTAGIVLDLFKSCDLLLEQTKAPPKLSKKGSKSALNDTRETGRTQKSQKSQKDKGKGPTKVSNLVKDRAGPFKPLPCVWDARFCLRIIELLNSEEVPWTSLEQRNQLRGRRDFHHWSLRSVLSVLTETNLEKRDVVSYVVKIAAVIYKRCICRFQDMCDFDDQTALGCVEVFKACLTLLFSTSYSLKMDVFLPAITSLTESTPTMDIATILEQIHTALVQIEEDGVAAERDSSIKKLVTGLVQTAAFLLEIPVHSCVNLNTVIIKLEDYVRTSKQDCLVLIPSLLSANCREKEEAQLIDELFLKLASALGRIDEDDTSAGADDSTDFPTVDSKSGHTVLNYICQHLNNRAKYTEHLLARARDLSAALVNATHGNQQRIDKELKELYNCTIIMLCQLSSWTSRCGKLRCCVGGGSDRVLNACVRLYCLLATTAKQMMADPKMAQLVRFESLLKLCGKKFSSVTDNLITYLEASQQQQSANKVLRDTKLIPRLVLEAEQFTKHIVLLDNKAKTNFQQYLSLGTARDFRIKAPVLEEVLKANEETRDNDETNINDAATEIISPLHSDIDDEENNGDTGTNKRKRRRVSQKKCLT